MKKVIFTIVTLITIFIPISCENFKLIVDCDKCYSNLPDKYSLELKITFDSENTSVPVTLYRGKINNCEIIDIDTVYANPYYSIEVEFGEYYSAIAKYRHNGRIIYAVDGQKLSRKLDESSCNESCYVISGDMLDLRLK